MRHWIKACGLKKHKDSSMGVQQKNPQPQSTISSSGMVSRKSGACPAAPSAKADAEHGFLFCGGGDPLAVLRRRQEL